MSKATRFAILTPAGQGAIATFGLHGPEAWTVARNLFRPRNPRAFDAEPVTGQFWLGQFGTEMVDEVVLTCKQMAPVSSVEIHCHGGREMLRMMSDLLVNQGLKPSTWQEFLQQTTPNRLASEAAIALAQATTHRTAAILLDQFHGSLTKAVEKILQALEETAPDRARDLLKNLTRWIPLGLHLTQPWRVVIAGPPNVGKSSLVNAIAGFQRSIVSPIPGTTRDIVTTQLALNGWPIQLFDTAGLRNETGALEAEGIGLARASIAQADLLLWMMDSSNVPVFPPMESDHFRIVINKIDLPPAWNLDEVQGAMRISVQTGAGLPELIEQVGKWLVREGPPAGAAIPFTRFQANSLIEAERKLVQGDLPEASRYLQASLIQACWES